MGRNLVIFQQIEYLLKSLLSNHKHKYVQHGDARSPVEKVEVGGNLKQAMLGQLVGKYLSDVLVDAGAEIEEGELPATAMCAFNFTFQIEGEEAFLQAMRRDLKLMTDERNALVHHFLPRWQPGNEEALNEALAYLEAQREKVGPMFEHLKATALRLQQSSKAAAEIFSSPEFESQLELMVLQLSPLVELLRDVAARRCRGDGWAYLSSARHIAARELPEELEEFKERYGFETLKQLLIGSELFEVMDETLPKGGFRTLYRLRASQ